MAIRIGLHSGPVTAGVLRGQKSRFQLFGDTVNTASRMESNGRPNQIQCSQQTADLLVEGNKSHWIMPRKDPVHAKGKGIIQTYWILSRATSSWDDDSQVSEERDEEDSDSKAIAHDEDLNGDVSLPTGPIRRGRSDISPHMRRLITWNVDLLANLLKQVVANRQCLQGKRRQSRNLSMSIPDFGIGAAIQRASLAISLPSSSISSSPSTTIPEPLVSVFASPREEYAEIIHLPKFDPNILYNSVLPSEVQLGDRVMQQLQDYVTSIALAYNDNPFHNFEHASHVTMSANKLLKRVVVGSQVEVRKASIDKLASHLHDFTYGITSDPLTHFACVFSSMIHDVDHPGVSNMQLIKEKDELADLYDKKSVAEQNSFDFSWELLMDSYYEDLRQCIFSDNEELKRFRQLVINSIMATDIFDPDLKKLRNDRWDKAFAVDENDGNEESEEKSGLRATIVIEHIIQAADVAHTMQHWHVYQKWNRRLFEEMYSAFKSGRGQDPSEGWYNGELWFYDNYIIPLAKKLKECGVFGPSSDEFLTYAMDNRSEWEAKGERLVQSMLEACLQQSEDLAN